MIENDFIFPSWHLDVKLFAIFATAVIKKTKNKPAWSRAEYFPMSSVAVETMV